MTRSDLESLLLRQRGTIEELEGRLSELEVLVENLNVQLGTHSHGAQEA